MYICIFLHFFLFYLSPPPSPPFLASFCCSVQSKIARMAEDAGKPSRDVLNKIVEQTLHVPTAVLNSMADADFVALLAVPAVAAAIPPVDSKAIAAEVKRLETAWQEYVVGEDSATPDPSRVPQNCAVNRAVLTECFATKKEEGEVPKGITQYKFLTAALKYVAMDDKRFADVCTLAAEVTAPPTGATWDGFLEWISNK